MPITEIITAGVTAATQDEIKGLVSRVFDSLSKGVKDFYNKAKVDIETAFTEYLFQSQNRYGTLKTLLYRNEPKWIYTLYEHNYLVKPEQTRSPTGTRVRGRMSTKNLLDVLAISRFLIITGTGGSGKSMMMRHFFVDAIVEERGVIPVFVELRELTRGIKLLDVMYASVRRLGFSLEKRYFEYALREGKFVILLDAYDEIPDNTDGYAFKEITTFCDTYSKNAFILSSRPNESFVQWERFTVRSVSPLTKTQACHLISMLEYDREVKARFLKELKASLFEHHESFASIPLLLNIMLLTYEQYAEIPEKVHLFYSQAFDTLFYRHDATKGGYKRERKCSLPSDDFQKILAEFCFRTYAKSQIAFTHAQLMEHLTIPCKKMNINPEDFLDDLNISVCILKLDGFDNYTFTHRSFQEYFAAVHLKGVPDDVQAKAGKWLVERDRYFGMHNILWILMDLDKDRFDLNIVLPYLTEWINSIEKSDKDITIASFFSVFSEIGVDAFKGKWHFFLSVNNETTGGHFLYCLFCHLLYIGLFPRVENDEFFVKDDIVKYIQETYGKSRINISLIMQDSTLIDHIKRDITYSRFYPLMKSYHLSVLEKIAKQQDEIDALFSDEDTKHPALVE